MLSTRASLTCFNFTLLGVLPFRRSKDGRSCTRKGILKLLYWHEFAGKLVQDAASESDATHVLESL